MQYRCTSCDVTFDVPEGDRPRCPKCLRIHDVERIEESSSSLARYRGPIVFFAIIIAAVGSYLVWYLSQRSDDETRSGPAPVSVGPLEPQELHEALSARDVEREDQVEPFEPSKAVQAFAREATHGHASAQEKAQALMDRLREMLDEHHELYRSISPRDTPVLGPGDTLAALQDDEPFQPYSFELSALMVTACRAVGIPAVLAEVYQFESARRPADASGAQGYFAVALPRGESRSYRRPLLFDPGSGRFGDNAAADAQPLTDVEAVGALLSLRALYAAAADGDTTRAEHLASTAVRLRPGSATALAARGTIRLVAGGGELSARAALEDYQAALQQRADPQRKVLVARVLLAMGQAAQAEELVRSALTDAPEFAAAHGLLGLILAAQEHFDEARAELSQAEQLDPADPHISLLWVQYYIGQHDLDAATEAARSVVDRIPDDPQARLLLARVLHENADYDGAEEQCRELLRRHPRNAQLREIIEQLFDLDPDELLARAASRGHADGGAESGADGGAESGTDGGVGGDAALAASSGLDGGAGSEDGSPGSFRLQLGQGLGKIRLGGSGGFQLNPGL